MSIVSSSVDGLEGLPSELFVKISLDPELSLRDKVRLFSASHFTYDQKEHVEKAYQIELKGKASRIFSILSKNFGTNLGSFQAGAIQALDGITLKDSEAAKAVVEAEFKGLITALAKEYLQSTGGNETQRRQLPVLANFVMERPQWVELAHQNADVRGILRTFHAERMQIPLKQMDTTLIQRLNGLLAQPQVVMPENFIVLIGNVDRRNGVCAKTVAALITKKDFMVAARILNTFPLDRDSFSEVIKALVETASLAELSSFANQIPRKNLFLHAAGLKYVELKHLEDAKNILELLDDKKVQKSLDLAITKMRYEIDAKTLDSLAKEGRVEEIFEFIRLNLKPDQIKVTLGWVAKTLACDSHFAQAIRVLNELQVDDLFIKDMVKFIKKDRLIEAESVGADIKDLTAQKLYLAEITRRREAEAIHPLLNCQIPGINTL